MKRLGVSRSGYLAWKKHILSDMELHREKVKAKIQNIYDVSHQNYGSPKITAELQNSGEQVSQKTIGNYMHQMGIRAQWIKKHIHRIMHVSNHFKPC